VLAVKVTLAPGFVVAASLVTRRFGPHIGGFLSGLPVVAGPILFVFALLHGRGFTADAATASLLGLISLATFIVVYALVATRLSWPASLLAGWAGYLACTGLLSAVHAGRAVALLAAWASFALGLAILRAPVSELVAPPPPPTWDLPLRALSAMALVVTLTTVSSTLGSHLSGLLATFPVVTTVLAAFTHAQSGHEDMRRLVRGMLTGLGGYSLFCFTISAGIRSMGTAGAFLLAIVVALLTQAAMFAVSQRAA